MFIQLRINVNMKLYKCYDAVSTLRWKTTKLNIGVRDKSEKESGKFNFSKEGFCFPFVPHNKSVVFITSRNRHGYHVFDVIIYPHKSMLLFFLQ